MATPLPHDERVVAEATQYAVAFHQRGMLAEAEKFYAAILNARPDHFNALHLLGVLRQQQGNSIEAKRLISAALELNPRSVDALCNLAGVLNALNLFDEALEASNKALAISPEHLDGLSGRSSALLGLSRFDEALATVDRTLGIKFDHFEALKLRGSALLQLNRLEEALAAFEKALALDADSIEALVGRGNALARLNRVHEALATFDRVIEVHPGHAIAIHGRGMSLVALKRYDEALESFDQALHIAPRNTSMLHSYGSALVDVGRHAEAFAAFDKVLAITPDHPDALTHRAIALRALGRDDEAPDRARGTPAAAPHDADALYNRGISLWSLGDCEGAIESYERASRLNHPRALSRLAISRLATADWSGTDKLTSALLSRVAEESFVDPLTSTAFGFEPSVQLRVARTCIRVFAPVAPKRFIHSPGRPTDKLRIAYLSSDFREHAVGMSIVELFERHDRSRFEVIGVSIGPGDSSGMRARIINTFDQFHDVASDTDRNIAKLLNDLQVHIAVGLNGLSGGCRPDILAYCPAPIQLGYLGFPGTTGADFMDYILADETVLPFDQQPFFTERIVHLPGCYHANDATRRLSPETPARSELKLPGQGLVFCCFNKSYKIRAPVFDVWMRLLTRVRASVLWLSDMNNLAKANLRREAKARGVDPDRLIFAPWTQRVEDHLARHRAGDLFLDTLPYNAHSTACDALWAGLPVITCMGATFAGRVGASMLKAAGLPELATRSLADYEALALKLATDPALLTSIRRQLEENRRTCPLFDSDRFRRHVETAYATMWDIHRRGERPRSFCVAPSA